MPKYHMGCVKTYHEYGEFEVEAESESAAKKLGLERMKDVDSETHYAPDLDEVYDISPCGEFYVGHCSDCTGDEETA